MPPAFTAEQTSQNEANTHRWSYIWNEANQVLGLDRHIKHKLQRYVVCKRKYYLK